MKTKILYTVNEFADKKGITPQTVRDWCKKGLIEFERTMGGHRRIIEYVDEDIRTFCYCRVSSYKQKDDLKRQVEFMKRRYPDAEIVKDIGSGLNFKRKGLRSLLEQAMSGHKFRVIVAHRDRFGRFGFDLLKWIFERTGGEVVVLDNTEHSPEQELTKDLLSILHVFSCRLHGLRSYKTKISKDFSIQESEDDIQALD